MRPVYVLAGLTAVCLGAVVSGVTRFAELFEDMPIAGERVPDLSRPLTHLVSVVDGELTVCDSWPSESIIGIFQVTGDPGDVDCVMCLDLVAVGGAL